MKQLIGLLLVLLCSGLSEAVCQSKYLTKVEHVLQQGDTTKALTRLNKYIAKHPKEAELYLKRARMKIQRGDLDPAMVDLNSYCSLQKDCGKANLLKGIVRFKQGDFNGAIAFLSSYTQKNEDPEAWSYLAQSHMWLQNYPVAINGFRRAIQINPKDVSAMYNAGLSAYYGESYSLADSFFQAAELLAPDDLDIRLARGLSLLRKGDHVESNKVFRRFEKDQIYFDRALYNIGVNYYNLDEVDLACDYWTRAIEMGHLGAESSKKKYCGKKRSKGLKR